MEIHPAALKHGVTEADIRHGEANAVAYGPAEKDVPGYMVFGPDRSGDLLELVIVARAGAEALVIHAMPMRRNTTICCRDDAACILRRDTLR